MKSKNVKLVTSHGILLCAILLGNNCSQFKATIDNGLNHTESSSLDGSRKVLSGNGLRQGLVAGCDPTLPNDFMETDPWHNRRIEPRDCAVIQLSTPVFAWLQPTDMNNALPMIFTLRGESNAFAISMSTFIPRILFPQPLQAGLYSWSVQYTNRSGSVITSASRRFSIDASNPISLPTGDVLTNSVMAKSHPRALPAGSTFAQIHNLAQSGEYKIQYTAFLSKAATLLNVAPPTPPPNYTRSNFSSDLEYSNWLLSLNHMAADEATAIEILGYAGYLTGNGNYLSAGLARMISLAAWDPSGATSESNQDQANREIYLALAMGLDLFQGQMSDVQKQNVVSVLKTRLTPVLSKFTGLGREPYDSHLLTATGFATECLMLVVGMPEFPEAQGWLSSVWETMITTAGTWGGQQDGAFANGSAYGWYAMTYFSHVIAAVKLISDVNLARWAPFGNTGMNQIAQTAANATMMGQMGDGIETSSNYYDYSWNEFRLLAALSGKPEYEWYWRAYPRNLTLQAPLPVYHFMMLGALSQPPAAPASTPNLPNSFLFPDAGYAVLHSKTTDTNRSSVLFRSSRFGSYNHSHADNNGFTFVSKGKELLISGGYYPFYNSPHHAMVGRATRFKNALTFDGGIGQAEPTENPTAPGAPIFSMEPRGNLINFDDNGTWAVVTGDATLAYRGHNGTTGAWTPLLKDAVRSVAYNRSLGVVVIYDWADSQQARTWELNFQSVNPPNKLSDQSFQIVNGEASACLDVYAPAGNLDISTGFPVAPESSLPDQSRARYSVQTPSNQLVSVTVIREDCRNIATQVSISGTSATVSLNGADPIIFNTRTIFRP